MVRTVCTLLPVMEMVIGKRDTALEFKTVGVISCTAVQRVDRLWGTQCPRRGASTSVQVSSVLY
jgi:hypothetical protein